MERGLIQNLSKDEVMRMKCIYCNSEENLTSSDIISYAITGAKLTKSFVCKTHNAFTNDSYEKEFVAGLDFFRSGLGFLTRDGKPIQFTADLTVDGIEMHDVRLSNKEALYNPKQLVAGKTANGEKILMGSSDKLGQIPGMTPKPVDISRITMHKTISSGDFVGNCALHSVAKIAYEWYCYINGIEQYTEENKDIVDYILGNCSDERVDIVVDGIYYVSIDQVSEVGTNSLFQYDDRDGYRYVVFDLWKTIAYRVKICKFSETSTKLSSNGGINLYLYHFDGRKTSTAFGIFSLNGGISFSVLKESDVNENIWKSFARRLEKLLTTKVMTIYTLKQECLSLEERLKKYDTGKIDLAGLIKYEEDSVLSTMEMLKILNEKKEQYDYTIGFNQNMKQLLSLSDDTYIVGGNDKKQFVQTLMELDQEKQLSSLLHEQLNTFESIYKSIEESN